MALSVHGLISKRGAATKMKFSCKSFFSKSEQILIISFKITPFFVQCDDKSEPINKTRNSSENKIFQRQKKFIKFERRKVYRKERYFSNPFLKL